MAILTYIETAGITNEWMRAYAGAHRLCVGYPDGVPETWRDVAPVKQGGGRVPNLPMKHFTDETRARIEARERAALAQMCPTCGGAGGGAAYPEHELDPAALSGTGVSLTVEQFDDARAGLRIRPDSLLWAIEGVGLVREDDLDGLKLIRRGETVGGIATVHEEDLDPAALLGPAAEPVGWPERDSASDEEC